MARTFLKKFSIHGHIVCNVPENAPKFIDNTLKNQEGGADQSLNVIVLAQIWKRVINGKNRRRLLTIGPRVDP